MELGGKDPAYVCDDSDLDYAVENIVDGAFFNSGQCCCAIERCYVQESVYAEFVEKAVALTEVNIIKHLSGQPPWLCGDHLLKVTQLLIASHRNMYLATQLIQNPTLVLWLTCDSPTRFEARFKMLVSHHPSPPPFHVA